MSGADPEPNKFLAVSFMTDAKQYRQAAVIISESRYEGVTSPHYFLIAQSIELYLKAYIIAAGGTRSQLMKADTRHSLEKLLLLASERGYSPRSKKTSAVVEMLAPHHRDHSFRYRKVGFKTYPTIREGLDTLERMDREISPIVTRSTPKL